MPATAGRVRMPANNRVHSSAALQTHGIWQSAIGYDPYAPDQKQPPPTAPGGDRDAQASLSAPSADQQNAYDSFQGLLALARLTGSNADEARGACRKCGRVGHLPFQCRNFLVLKDEAALAAANAAAAAFGSYPDGGNGSSHRKDRTHGKRRREDTSGRVSDLSSEEDESSETDESGLSDSSEDSEMERAVAAKYGKNVLNTLSKKGKSTHSKEQSRRKRSHSKRSKGRRDVSSGDSASSEEDLKKAKYRSRSKRSHKESDLGTDEQASDSESERERQRKRRRHSHKHSKSKSKHRSKHSDESSEGERTKRSKKKGSSRQHADRKHG